MNSNINPLPFDFETASIIATRDPSIGYGTGLDFILFPEDGSFAFGLAYPFDDDYSKEKFDRFRNEMVEAFIINAAHQTQTFGNYYLRNYRTGEMFSYTLDRDVYQTYYPTEKQ